MKSNFRISSIICSILVGIAMLSCTTQQPVEQVEKSSLEGVWKLVSGEWSMQDTVYNFPGGDFKGMKSYKYFSKTHWANIGQDTASDLFFAHAGLYRITEETYVEYFDLHNNIKSIGDSAVFKSTLDGDKWTISSDWLKEEWERIE
jgi:hypothetical protein